VHISQLVKFKAGQQILYNPKWSLSRLGPTLYALFWVGSTHLE